MKLFRILAAAFALFLTLASVASGQQPVRADNLVSHGIITEGRTLVPGQTQWIAIRQTIEPGWHTYWENAGDAGGPTRVDWTSNTDVSVSPIHWPTPQIIPYEGLLSHAYEDEALLLFQVSVPAGTDATQLSLTANLDYLVCSDICIPGTGSASLTWPIGSGAGLTDNASDIRKARSLLPTDAPFKASLFGNALTLQGPGIRPERITELRFLPSAPGVLDHNVDQPLRLAAGEATLSLTAKGDGDIPAQLSGLLLVTERTGAGASSTVSQGFTLALGGSTYANGGPPVPLPAGAIVTNGIDWSALGVALSFAFLGGLILNLMPCVFPILSIKAMAIARSSGMPDGAKAWAFFAGVLTSFALLGALFLALRASGAALGWGFQFQSPAFVAAMAALFFTLALNMLGLFEIRTSLEGSGDRLTRHDGPTGSFFTGALATLAATPCTAPFMGAALGYALTQPAFVAMAIILMLGLGFATPMTLLGLSQRFSALLPRPGAWMVTLRRWLAIPLLATVVWLSWILWLQTGVGGLIILFVGLVALALALTLVGRAGKAPVRVGGALTALLLGIGVSWAATTQMPSEIPSYSADQTAWSPQRVEQLRADGRSVFVDFTAAWCITCKVNEAAVIDTAGFRELLTDNNAQLLVADWTVQDPRITQVLERHGRAGVPLYLLYAPGDGEPDVLPQILTLDAVRAAFNAS